MSTPNINHSNFIDQFQIPHQVSGTRESCVRFVNGLRHHPSHTMKEVDSHMSNEPTINSSAVKKLHQK